MTGGAVSVGVRGAAVVVCIHDREKRVVTTEKHVAELAPQVGQTYDPKQHRLWLCACCENLFVDASDEPRYCRRCQIPSSHPQAGPLRAPTERPTDV
jgi:uncharacterized paraquat-inducible protein A